jgi:hypothetical protein
MAAVKFVIVVQIARRGITPEKFETTSDERDLVRHAEIVQGPERFPR